MQTNFRNHPDDSLVERIASATISTVAFLALLMLATLPITTWS